MPFVPITESQSQSLLCLEEMVQGLWSCLSPVPAGKTSCTPGYGAARHGTRWDSPRACVHRALSLAQRHKCPHSRSLKAGPGIASFAWSTSCSREGLWEHPGLEGAPIVLHQSEFGPGAHGRQSDMGRKGRGGVQGKSQTFPSLSVSDQGPALRGLQWTNLTVPSEAEEGGGLPGGETCRLV